MPHERLRPEYSFDEERMEALARSADRCGALHVRNPGCCM